MLYQSATGFSFKDTATKCNQGAPTAKANWHTTWLDTNNNIVAGVDCGGDFYSTQGNAFLQLGLPELGNVTAAGGYTLAGNTSTWGPGYYGITTDSRYVIAGVRCTGLLFFYNGVHAPIKPFGCFDINGNFAINGQIYTSASSGRRVR